MKLKLGKEKRLKSRKSIDRLFLSGRRIQKFPLKAVYNIDSNSAPEFRVAVSVPKKLFKKAVQRNLLKRRMREAFRQNQHKLQLNGNLEIMFIYSTNEIHDFQKIETAMLALIGSLNSISIDNNSEK